MRPTLPIDWVLPVWHQMKEAALDQWPIKKEKMAWKYTDGKSEAMLQSVQ